MADEQDAASKTEEATPQKLAKAREKARQASCLSNVRQLLTAILSYSQDYDERLPLTPDPGALSYLWWDNTVQPYIKNRQILKCPSAVDLPVG